MSVRHRAQLLWVSPSLSRETRKPLPYFADYKVHPLVRACSASQPEF
jgi:hypothetical protein